MIRAAPARSKAHADATRAAPAWRRGALSVAGALAVVFLTGAASGESPGRKDPAGDLGEFRTSLDVALVAHPNGRAGDLGELRTRLDVAPLGPLGRRQQQRRDLGEFRTTLDVGPIARPRELGEFRAILDVGPEPRPRPRGVDLGEFRMSLDAPPPGPSPLR